MTCLPWGSRVWGFPLRSSPETPAKRAACPALFTMWTRPSIRPDGHRDYSGTRIVCLAGAGTETRPSLPSRPKAVSRDGALFRDFGQAKPITHSKTEMPNQHPPSSRYTNSVHWLSVGRQLAPAAFVHVFRADLHAAVHKEGQPISLLAGLLEVPGLPIGQEKGLSRGCDVAVSESRCDCGEFGPRPSDHGVHRVTGYVTGQGRGVEPERYSAWVVGTAERVSVSEIGGYLLRPRALLTMVRSCARGVPRKRSVRVLGVHPESLVESSQVRRADLASSSRVHFLRRDDRQSDEDYDNASHQKCFQGCYLAFRPRHV